MIGGFAANNAALDAIGSLSVLQEDEFSGQPYFQLVCSGALISDNTVLTAKHCVEAVSSVPDYDLKVVFALGPNASAPSRWFEVVDMDMAPGDRGGFNGYGHDVAVLHLADHVTSVKPLGIAQVDDALLGANFVGIGYGVQDNGQRVGSRRLGKLQLRARSGLTYEALLGSFEAFFEWYTGQPYPQQCDDGADGGVAGSGGLPPIIIIDGPGVGAGGSGPSPVPVPVEGPVPIVGDIGSDCFIVQYLRATYESTRLQDEAEVVAGGAEGDAQPCYGDSGSPLVRADDSGQLAAYGVVSGGVDSRRLVCDYGAVYAGFDDEVLGFLTEAKHWVDPCLGLSTRGVCDGTIARRCSTRLEGKRRPLEFDCAAVGLSCETQKDGSIGCGSDDSNFAAAPTPPLRGRPIPDVMSTEHEVFRQPGAAPAASP